MLVLREYKEKEIQEIKRLLMTEKVQDLNINGIIYVMVEDNNIIGVSKIEIENDIGNLKYLVIKENRRKQGLGNGLLRAILNKLDNQEIKKVYYKENNLYLMKFGFDLNENNTLELVVPIFFSRGCQCSGENNEI